MIKRSVGFLALFDSLSQSKYTSGNMIVLRCWIKMLIVYTLLNIFDDVSIRICKFV